MHAHTETVPRHWLSGLGFCLLLGGTQSTTRPQSPWFDDTRCMIPPCVPAGNPKALEFLRMDCTNVLSFFGKLGVTVPSIRRMFDFVVNPDITPARVDERFAAVRPVVLSLFSRCSPCPPPSLPPFPLHLASTCTHLLWLSSHGRAVVHMILIGMTTLPAVLLPCACS